MYVYRHVGDDLGLDVDGIHNDIAPVKQINHDGCTEEDYLFVHTDSHKEFMALLLEKRKKLESDVTAKLKSREKAASEGKGVWCCVAMVIGHVIVTCTINYCVFYLGAHVLYMQIQCICIPTQNKPSILFS